MTLHFVLDVHRTLLWFFFLWGHLKSNIHVPALSKDLDESKSRVTDSIGSITVDTLQRPVYEEFEYRLDDVCRANKGGHIEHFKISYLKLNAINKLVKLIQT